MTTRIIGTGSAVPERIVTNDDLANMMDTSDEWIRSRTGIGERHITSQGTTQLAVEAAKRALDNAGVAAEDIDIIVMGTTTADHIFPSGACEVQEAIGAVHACAYDISAACSGFLFSLNTVHAFIQSGIYQTGLVIGADTVSRLMDWEDRGTCVLFGDGAGAAVVRASETGIRHLVMRSDGRGKDVLSCTGRAVGNFITGKPDGDGYTSMDGQEVFRFAVKRVPETIQTLVTESGTSLEEIKYLILHQANYRIFESIAKRLKLPLEKFPMNLERYGNTSGASIPILLDELNRDGRLHPGDKLILSGFGAGLTWGATLLEW